MTKSLVSAPEGRGTAATYGYRHLLQVLSIKLHQMKGDTLETIAREMAALQGDQLERRTAMSLGPALPPPDEVMPVDVRPRGGASAASGGIASDGMALATAWRRISISRGLELHIAAEHPVSRAGIGDRSLAEAILRAVEAIRLGAD